MKKIISYLRKNWETPLLIIFWVVFVLIYTYRLSRFPIFEDEAELLLISGKVLESPANNLFLLMKFGPLPALSWFVAVFSFFTKDTLLGGRLLNVVLASTLLFWSYFITKFYKFPKRFFVFSSLLITFSPILLLNARVALWDTAVLVFSAWYLYSFLLVLKKPNLLNTLTLCFLLVFSFLIKFTSFFAIPGILLLVVLKFAKKEDVKKITKTTIPILLSFAVFISLVYSFRTPIIDDAASSFIAHSSPGDIFRKIHQNIWLYINWLKVYYSFYILYLISFVHTLLRYKLKKSPPIIGLLFIWFLVSSLMMISFNRFFYPRHILILVLPIMIITSYFLLQLPKAVSGGIVVLAIILRILLFRDILTNYFRADLAKEDRFQYFEDYTSGVNVEDISGYLLKLSEYGRIVVWLDGSWVMEYGLRRNIQNNKNVVFKSFVEYDEGRLGKPQKIVSDPFGVNYVIVNKREPTNIKALKLVKEFSWGGHKHQYLYRY